MKEYAWALILFIVLFFTLLTIIFYYTRDKYEPEPISRVFIAFIYGVLSVIPAIIISLVASTIVPSNTILFSILFAPIIEEFSKGYFVVILSRNDNFDGPLDGIIYGAMVGCGFAAIENLLYGFSVALTFSYSSGIELTFFRSLSLIIGHPFYTGLMGAGVGAHKVGMISSEYQEIWISIVFHSVWNGVASFSNPISFFTGLILVISISIYKLRIELKKAIELDKIAFEQGYYTKKKLYYEHLAKQRRENFWVHPYTPENNNELD